MPRVAVVDTNIVVGGLLTQTPSPPLVCIVDGMLAGRFPFILCPLPPSARELAVAELQRLAGCAAWGAAASPQN